jgi:hypothetical protein
MSEMARRPIGRRIAVECNPDTILVRALGNTNVAHARSKAAVIRYVHEHENTIGLVDEDPRTTPPRKLNDFVRISQEDDLIIMEWMNRRIIVVQPRLEEWILSRAKELHIDVREAPYNLADLPEDLHGEINAKLDSFRRLIEDMRVSPKLNRLSSLLKGD